MTPEERRELAERLDRMAARNERTAKEMGGLGYGWANGAADLRAAAAALRKDAGMGQRASDELRERLADAVVIPRSAIPDGLVERLETRRGAHRSTQDKIDQIAAARLLSGGATEGRTCWPEEGT